MEEESEASGASGSDEEEDVADGGDCSGGRSNGDVEAPSGSGSDSEGDISVLSHVSADLAIGRHRGAGGFTRSWQ